jgi:hypothetical protein
MKEWEIQIYSASDFLRIRTAADLLKVHPKLAKDEGWEKFAQEFDKPEYCKSRAVAARACRPEAKKEILELRKLCEVVRTDEWIAQISQLRDDGTSSALTSEQASSNRIAASVALAKKMELLLGGTDKGNALLRIIEAEGKRRAKKEAHRNSMDCCVALLEFSQREERLPTKQELAIEANRLIEIEKIIDQRKHGDVVKKSGSESIADQYYVYDCRQTLKFDHKSKPHVPVWECRITPRHLWSAPRWIGKEYNSASKPVGLMGLPVDNKAKGIREVG